MNRSLREREVVAQSSVVGVVVLANLAGEPMDTLSMSSITPDRSVSFGGYLGKEDFGLKPGLERLDQDNEDLEYNG